MVCGALCDFERKEGNRVEPHSFDDVFYFEFL